MLRLDVIKKYIKLDQKVLDLGCANHDAINGQNDERWLHKILTDINPDVVGIELEEDQVEFLNSAGYNVLQGDVTSTNFVNKFDQKFDVIVAGELIEHISNFDQFFLNIEELLSDQGVCILTTPYIWNFYNILSSSFRGRVPIHEQHTVWFDEVVIKQLINRYQLTISDTVFTTWERGQRGFLFSRFLKFFGARRLVTSGMVIVVRKKP